MKLGCSQMLSVSVNAPSLGWERGTYMNASLVSVNAPSLLFAHMKDVAKEEGRQ